VVSFNSTLKVFGDVGHPVSFQGDRLDEFYRDLPGQWTGIILERGSRDHEIDHALIKNGKYGLVIDSLSPTGPIMLKLNNTLIQNMTADDIYAYSTSIESVNCVLGNCGGSGLNVEKGGSYDFRQLTIANYWSSSIRFVSALRISNYTFDTLGNMTTAALQNAYFGNSIIYGNENSEISLDKANSETFNFKFENSIVKIPQDTVNIYPGGFVDCLVNEDPVFVEPSAFNFRIDSLSPAINAGIPMGVPLDIDGVNRGSSPDLGAYEWFPSALFFKHF
jgi:hypothetical protein